MNSFVEQKLNEELKFIEGVYHQYTWIYFMICSLSFTGLLCLILFSGDGFKAELSKIETTFAWFMLFLFSLVIVLVFFIARMASREEVLKNCAKKKREINVKNFNTYDAVSFFVSCEENFNLTAQDVQNRINFLYEEKKVDEIKKLFEKTQSLEEYNIMKQRLEKAFEEKTYMSDIGKDMADLALGNDN